MKVTIYSKFKMEELLEMGPLKNVAVISFYSEPVNILTKPIDYTGKAERFMQINLPDIDEGGLKENGYTFDSFFTESNTVANLSIKRIMMALTLLVSVNLDLVEAPPALLPF